MDWNARGGKAGKTDEEMHRVGCGRSGAVGGQSGGEWEGAVSGIGRFFLPIQKVYAFFVYGFPFSLTNDSSDMVSRFKINLG